MTGSAGDLQVVPHVADARGIHAASGGSTTPKWLKTLVTPTSRTEPMSAPAPAPIAAPRNGTSTIRPNRKPQKAPPSALAFLLSLSSCVIAGYILL